jgi:hypothetical protein
LCAGEFFFNGDGCKAPDKLLSLLSEKVKLQKGLQRKEKNYNIALQFYREDHVKTTETRSSPPPTPPHHRRCHTNGKMDHRWEIAETEQATRGETTDLAAESRWRRAPEPLHRQKTTQQSSPTTSSRHGLPEAGEQLRRVRGKEANEPPPSRCIKKQTTLHLPLAAMARRGDASRTPHHLFAPPRHHGRPGARK